MVEESELVSPVLVRAKGGISNVLFIVLDDTGFGQLSCYSGPLETPSIDKLVKNGLRYNNMHTISPTPSYTITWCNHRSNAVTGII